MSIVFTLLGTQFFFDFLGWQELLPFDGGDDLNPSETNRKLDYEKLANNCHLPLAISSTTTIKTVWNQSTIFHSNIWERGKN